MPKIPEGGQQQVGLVAPLTAHERSTVTPTRSDRTMPTPPPVTAYVSPVQAQPAAQSSAAPAIHGQVRSTESSARRQQQQEPMEEGEPMSELPAPPPGMLLDASEDAESVSVSVNRVSSGAASVSSQVQAHQMQCVGGAQAPAATRLPIARQHETSSASSASVSGTGTGTMQMISGRGSPSAAASAAAGAAARPTNPVAAAMIDDSSMSASASTSDGCEPFFPPPLPDGVPVPAYEHTSGIISRDRLTNQLATPIKTSLNAGEFDV